MSCCDASSRVERCLLAGHAPVLLASALLPVGELRRVSSGRGDRDVSMGILPFLRLDQPILASFDSFYPGLFLLPVVPLP